VLKFDFMPIGTVKVKCCTCGKVVKKNVGHVNMSKKMGLKFFCNQKCFGVSRRHNKTEAQCKEEKRLYDIQYREKNEERLKKRRHDWFMQDYAKNPEKYKKERQRRYPKHLEYLRKPEYREYKKDYDVKYLAKKYFGIYWESAKKSDASELKLDVKVREETLSYIRNVMQNNNMQHPDELFKYWKNKHDKVSEMWKRLEESDPLNQPPQLREGEVEDGWVKDKPKDDKEFLMLTASFINGFWEYKTWEVRKITSEDGFYFGLCDGEGEEWADYNDLATATTPISPTINTFTKLTNDGAGPNTTAIAARVTRKGTDVFIAWDIHTA